MIQVISTYRKFKKGVELLKSTRGRSRNFKNGKGEVSRRRRILACGDCFDAPRSSHMP